MFTGLVAGQGRIVAVELEPAGMRLLVAPPANLRAEPTAIGDSIAINGCCLTLVAQDAAGWSFQAGTETLSKTNLGQLQVGTAVNLEPAMRANDRLGGHFVQGHVDGTGTVATILHDADWVTMGFTLPADLAEQLVPKGSITVDGVSLTVVEAQADRFTVALIPHTLQCTTLGTRRVGDIVNLETDMLGKYVRKLVLAYLPRVMAYPQA